MSMNLQWDCRCSDRMVVGFTTIFAIRSVPISAEVMRGCVFDRTLCDKVCQ